MWDPSSSDQGLNLLQWKGGVLTTGWQGRSVSTTMFVSVLFFFLTRQAVPTDLTLLSNPSCLKSEKLHPWPLSICLSVLSSRDEEAFHVITEEEELGKCRAALACPFLSGACVPASGNHIPAASGPRPPGMSRHRERDSSPAALGRKERLMLKLSFSQCAAHICKPWSP